MANLPISGLTASAANLASTDVAPVVQTTGVGPVKMTGLQLAGGLLGAASFNGATVTTSQPVLNLSQTWNAGAVTFTGLKFNATDTASAAGSLLLDLQVGGSTIFNVAKSGNLNWSSGNVVFGFGGAAGIAVRNFYSLVVRNNGSFGFVSDGNLSGGTIDTFLTRAAAATLQLGAADAAAPVAQTLQVQSVVAGTTNTAGANWTLKGSAGTGTGAGGSIIFQVAPAGTTGTAQNAYATALTIAGNTNATFANTVFAAGVGTATGSTAGVSINYVGNGITCGSAAPFTWTDGTISGTSDVVLRRDAANTLALRNGAGQPQTLRVYNTYSSAADNEYLTLDWSTSANVATIGTVANGTGTVRTLQIKSNYQMNLYSAAGGSMFFFTNGTARWYFDGAAGHLLANADNTYDIGASGANRPRNLYIGSSFRCGDITATSNIICGSTAYFGVNARLGVTAPSDGVMLLQNWASTDFGRLQFGGTTSSFPALKRSSATLQVRLADDSAFADIGARGVIHNGVTFANLPGTPTTGTVAYVTDASNAGAAWGDSVTAGGSTNKYLVWYNGTNWTVVGK